MIVHCKVRHLVSDDGLGGTSWANVGDIGKAVFNDKYNTFHVVWNNGASGWYTPGDLKIYVEEDKSAPP